MVTLKHLRILIMFSWIVFILEYFIVKFYNPTVYSPILHLGQNFLNREFANNHFFRFFLLLEALFLIYSSTALWFAYQSSKWTYLLFLLFALLENIFVPAQAFSSLGIILDNLRFLIIGAILCLLFYTPLKNKIAEKKTFYLWPFLGVFFIFYAFTFILPLMISFLINR